MSFRRRLVLATGIAVAVAIVLASVAVYVLVRAELRGQVDAELSHFSGGVFEIRVRGDVLRDDKALAVRGRALGKIEKEVRQKVLSVGLPRDPLGGLTGYAQFVSAKGQVIGPIRKEVSLPVTSRTIAVARGEAPAFFSDTEVNGVHARVYTGPAGKGKAVQAARSLEEVDDALRRLALVLVLVSGGGIGLALGLALLVGRTAVQPVQRLTEAAEHVASTRDLSRRIEAGGRDELARLAGSFNTMLAALERSLGAQRQLVADASHELRTPLTSLRTNVEVLADADRLSPGERRQLVADVVAQLEELTALVGDLIDLAREEEQPSEREHLRFDLLVAAAIERARRNHPQLRAVARLEPCVVHATASRLDRAVANLLDNARKWSPPGGEVEITLHEGVLEVRDHGPGFAAGDIDHVFDRFYRSPSARRQPGSGLGLAIVRQVAESHGGSVEAANAPGGGGLLRLRLRLSAAVAPAAASQELVLASS